LGGILFSASIAEGLRAWGDHYFGRSSFYNPDRAERLYRLTLLIHKENRYASHQLARLAFLEGSFDEALLLINQQIQQHGTSFMSSYYIRGLIHGYRKEYAEAERDFSFFLEWDPENWAALNDLAWIHFAQGDYISAKETAGKGLVVDPHNPWLLTMRGMSRFNLDDLLGAKDDLERAQKEAQRLDERDWERAYPGNDPRIASAGIASVQKTIEMNLALVHKQLAPEGE
jgi:tetratricopeptide (TPR) repeat protein